eukprot:gene8072-2812_t
MTVERARVKVENAWMTAEELCDCGSVLDAMRCLDGILQ